MQQEHVRERLSYDDVVKCKDQLRQWLNIVLIIYLKLKKLATLRKKSCNMNVCKAWLKSSEGAEQVSSSWENFLRSRVKIKCRVSIRCRVGIKCPVIFRCQVNFRCQVKFRCRVMFMCRASVKLQWVPSTSISIMSSYNIIWKFIDSPNLSRHSCYIEFCELDGR